MKMAKLIVSIMTTILIPTINAPIYTSASSTSNLDSATYDVSNIDFDILIDRPDDYVERYDGILSVTREVIASDVVERCASAYRVDQNGRVEELTCELELFTIEADPNAFLLDSAQYDGNTADPLMIYVLKGTTKDTSSNCSGHGVSLSGTITWVDNFGPTNEFISASGSRSGDYINSGRAWVRKNTVMLVGWTYFNTSFSASADPNIDNTGLQFTLHIDSDTQDGNNIQLAFSNSVFS